MKACGRVGFQRGMEERLAGADGALALPMLCVPLTAVALYILRTQLAHKPPAAYSGWNTAYLAFGVVILAEGASCALAMSVCAVERARARTLLRLEKRKILAGYVWSLWSALLAECLLLCGGVSRVRTWARPLAVALGLLSCTGAAAVVRLPAAKEAAETGAR